MRKDYERLQSAGVVFGNWKLVPMDGENWELAHRHVSARGKNKGHVQWNRVGRYYQYDTIENALRYAADHEAMDGNSDEESAILEALTEYGRITRELLDGVREALGDA